MTQTLDTSLRAVVGSTVTLVDDDGDTMVYTLVDHDADKRRRELNIRTPLGRALLGKVANDRFDVEAQSGNWGGEVRNVA